MNIGFEAKRFFTNYTGLGNYSRFVVDALSSNVSDDHYYLFTPRNKINNEVSGIVNRANVEIVQPEGVYRLAPSVWRTFGLSHGHIARNLNIFHGLSHELPFSLPSKVKKVVTVHDLIFYRFPELYQAVDVAIYKAKVKSACSRADKIIAISKQTAEDLIDFIKVNPSKIEVVYQGCHPGFKRNVTEEEIKIVKQKYKLPENYFLNVGTIEERKNLIVLIKALALLPKDQRLPLVVIGRQTEYFKRIISTAQTLGVLESIIFINNASFDDFPALYRGAQFFVYPSLFEGFGIPLVEAIQCSVPVITSQGSCFHEAAGPDALYIDPKDAEDLKAKIQLVMSDESLRKRMVENSLHYVKKFDPPVIAAELNRVYTSL